MLGFSGSNPETLIITLPAEAGAIATESSSARETPTVRQER
jgi:hypothetical protein